MRVDKIGKNIIKVTADNSDCNLNEYSKNLIFLESKNILTFGDTNFKIFEKYFIKNGYKPESFDLCFDDDKSIGLEVPQTWYLNKGKNSLSIAMYYNYLNFREIIKNKNIKTFNAKIAKEFGRISCIEIYFEKELKQLLNFHKIKYFGTPKTLTECVRYLEGWNLKDYPRLKGYATFAKFIELWSSVNFPDFNFDEWYLGKEKSNSLNKKGVTNVRKAVVYFWKKYLLKTHRSILVEDVEVDILDGKKFSKIRQPQIILISEDLFSAKNSDLKVFEDLSGGSLKDDVVFPQEKNNFQEKNAKIARKLYPNSLIALIKNDESFDTNFSLMNPVKQSINVDVVVATKILKYIIEKF